MITTEHLVLRPWDISDAEALYKYASEPLVSRLALWPAHTSVEMSKWVINNIFIPNEDTYAIVLKETHEAIGCIGLVPGGDEHYHAENGEREIGYWIGLPFWNKGLTSEALVALMNHWSNYGTIRSLLITTDDNNLASQRVAYKCGFKLIDRYQYNGIPSSVYRAQLSNLRLARINKK